MAATIRTGSRGSSVRVLQRRLRAAGFNPGPIDGIFGPRTRSAVIAYQRAQGIQVDGIVGPQTWGRLGTSGGGGGGGGGKSSRKNYNYKQIPEPDKAETWRQGVHLYVVYRVPGKNIRLLYEIEDGQQRSAIFGPGQYKGADRNLTKAQLKKTGAIRMGGSMELANLSGHPIRTIMDTWRDQQKTQPWLRDKEIMAKFVAAGLEGRQLTQAELQSTKWYRSRSDAERAWISLRASDPSSARNLAADNRKRVRDALIRFGVRNPPGWLTNSVANAFTRGDITQADMEQAIRKIADPFAPGGIHRNIRKAWGKRSLRNVNRTQDREDEVRQLVRTYLGPNHGKWKASQVRRWAGILRNDPDGQQKLTNILQKRLKGLYGVEDPEMTWDDLAQPWINMATQTWGRNVKSTDGIVERLIRLNDGHEAGKILRQAGVNRGYGTVTNDVLQGMIGGFDLDTRPVQ